MRTLFINVGIRFTLPLSWVVKLNSFQIMRLHFCHSDHSINQKIPPSSGAGSGPTFNEKKTTETLKSISSGIGELAVVANQNRQQLNTYVVVTVTTQQST